MTKMCSFFIYILLNSMTEKCVILAIFFELYGHFPKNNSSYIGGEHDEDIGS